MADSSRAWCEKYRPRTINEYAGKRIRDIIERRFTKEELRPHIFMISGTRGCGKTTITRIIHKYYLCENPNPDGTPCEVCDTCTEINEKMIAAEDFGVEVSGVTEVDATTANGTADIQEIMNDALIPPLWGKYKIVVFDECHRISKQAQNTLLKILEGAPPHLIVMFATTDPDQVISTIHSRCQLKIRVQKQTVEEMADRLNEISKLEKLHVTREALEMIAKVGDRIPRECISILENVAKSFDGEVNIANVTEVTGDLGTDTYIEYMQAANTSLESILEFTLKLRDAGADLESFASGLVKFTTDCMYIKHGLILGDYTPQVIKQVKKVFDMYTTQDFDMLMQIVDDLVRSVNKDNENKSNMEIILTAMRIGKISLLSKGLAKEREEAIKENKVSLVEHKKLLDERNAKVTEEARMEVDEEMVRDGFSGAREVTGTANLLMSMFGTSSDDGGGIGINAGRQVSIEDDHIQNLIEESLSKDVPIEGADNSKKVSFGDDEIDAFFNGV